LVRPSFCLTYLAFVFVLVGLVWCLQRTFRLLVESARDGHNAGDMEDIEAIMRRTSFVPKGVVRRHMAEVMGREPHCL